MDQLDGDRDVRRGLPRRHSTPFTAVPSKVPAPARLITDVLALLARRGGA
jgi:hypothetical protein